MIYTYIKGSLLLCLVLFSSCITVPYNQTAEGILSTFHGEEYHQLILEMGPPNGIYSDGKNGRILHWEETTQYTRPGLSYSMDSGSVDAKVESWDNVLWGEASYQGTSYTAYMPPRTVYNTNFIQFYIDPDGIVYHHRTNTPSPEEQKANRHNAQAVYWGKVAAYTVGISAVVLLALNAGGGGY
ncbi:MAG: hypothetical protein WEA58_11515 [Balneolaceae bacterium]